MFQIIEPNKFFSFHTSPWKEFIGSPYNEDNIFGEMKWILKFQRHNFYIIRRNGVNKVKGKKFPPKKNIHIICVFFFVKTKSYRKNWVKVWSRVKLSVSIEYIIKLFQCDLKLCPLQLEIVDDSQMSFPSSARSKIFCYTGNKFSNRKSFFSYEITLFHFPMRVRLIW